MSAAGSKIIEGLREAVAGDFAAVTIDGVRWVRRPATWRPISTAPKDGTRVLVFGHWDDRAAEHCKGHPHLCIAVWSTFMSDGSAMDWHYEGVLGNTSSDYIAVTFTHWMPLPEPPSVSRPAPPSHMTAGAE